MAIPAPSVALSPQVIASAFVDQYYRILHSTPDQVYRFYQESSILSRSEPNGDLVSVTTLQAINEKIQSMDVRNHYWEIETADAQLSYMNGVFIVVTGCLTGPDMISRRFTQSFFLAPQETNGYFVLNDVLRVFLDRPVNVPVLVPVPVGTTGVSTVPVSGGATSTGPQVVLETVIIAPLQEPPAPVKENGHVSEVKKSNNNNNNNNKEVKNEPAKENGGTGLKGEKGQTGRAPPVSAPPVPVTKEAVSEQPKQQPKQVAAHSKPKQTAQSKPKQSVQVKQEDVAQKDASKKSYASIVIKGSPVPKQVQVQAAVTKPKPVIEKAEKEDSKPVQTQEAEDSNNTTLRTNKAVSENSSSSEVQGYSIYVRNLPADTTVEQMEEHYKKYGPIKPNGIQVKMHRFDRYFFGFVEFETLESMQAAIEGSPIYMDGKQVYCEEKKSSLRVLNGYPTRGETGIMGPRGPLHFRDNTGGYYNNDSFRGGRGGPHFRGGRGGPRFFPGQNRPRDGYRHQRTYQNSNGPSGGPPRQVTSVNA